MFGLGYIVQNVSTTLSGLGFVPMKSESGNAFDLSYIPVSKIKTDEKNFQNRADKYSAKSVEAIIKAVKNGNFNWFAFDPVLLWENENGDLIVLSGHSRTEAFRRLSAENPDLEIDGLSFKKIPAKIFKGSFANAKNLALNSNALSTPETLIERAEFYRKQRKNLSSNADIKALRDKALRENQGSVIWDLSYLPENGLALDSLKRFKLQEDSEAAFENFIRAVNIAQWIGKAFQIYKGLSSAHDAELFKFLLKNYGNKSGQYNSFSKLNERLSVLYPRNVKDDKKINEKGEYQNAFGLAIFEKNDDEISELETLKTDSDKAKRELQNKIKELRGRTTDKAKIFEVVTPYFNEYINNLFQYWQELDRERQKIVDKNQGSLFGLGATYKQTSLLFPDTANVNQNLITTKGGLQVSIPFKGQSKQLAFDFDAVVKDIKEDLKKAETVEDVEQTQEKVEEINKVLDIVADNIAKALEEQKTESDNNSLPDEVKTVAHRSVNFDNFQKRFENASGIDVSEDSTDLKPLNGFVFSENTAVFNCPMSELNCMGFKPTYKKLSSYDDLIDKAQGDKTLVGYGFETATLEELNNACKYYKQVEKLAAHLKADTPLQSAFNVWYFLHDNILYNYDTEGQEEIRTPARTWQDRFKGVDCDCLAVFTACLLYNMGYKPAFEIVGFYNNDCYSHIFVNLDGLAVDRVLPVFLKRPSGITKTFIMNIPVFELNGGVDMLNDCELSGIFESTLKKVNSKNATTADNVDFQKIQTLLCLQNSDSNAYKLASILMPFVAAIDDNGNYYFSDSTVADYAEKADNIISNLNTSGATKEDFNNFFNDFVSSFREISVECNTAKDAPFVSVTITNAAKPFTVEGNMIEKKLITLNPNFNRIKEAILFLLSVNYADLAKKIAVGLLPLDRVVNNGYNEEKWENAKIANAKLFEFWRLLGGDTALLIENIKDGYYNNLSGCKTLSGVDSIDETITTDIAVERIGNFLAVLLDWYKDIEPLNIIQNNEYNFANSVSADSNNLEDNSLLSSKAFIAEQPKISVSNPGLWIVAAAALGLSAVALSKNKK